MTRTITLASPLLLLLLLPSARAFLSPIGIQVKHSLATTQSATRSELHTLYSTSEWQGKIASPITQSVNQQNAKLTTAKTISTRRGAQMKTLLRVSIPSLLIGVIACLSFPALSMTIASLIADAGAFSVLSQDASQFVQNFLNVAGLLFSILVGQTYYFLYTQQESIFYALFEEVTEAKSLLEQVALVCQGRSMYHRCLEAISRYVQNDLKMIHSDPAVLLSARPVDDPLEAIMYMTSVGVPGSVYDTVKSLREARARRLGALQRKLPPIHMLLLWVLAGVLLVSFPLLGAGTQTIGGFKLLTVEGTLFGVMTSGIILTLRIIGELWRPAGGAYNVDAVLSVMVSGLEQELKARRDGQKINRSSRLAPSGPNEEWRQANSSKAGETNQAESSKKDETGENPEKPIVLQQGADISVAVKRVTGWIGRRWKINW